MGKLKTYKGASKRLKITKKNKLMFSSSNSNHLKAKKPARIKYKKRLEQTVNKKVAKKTKQLMPGLSTL